MLATIAFILGILWIIGFFFLHAGPWIHILIALAVILTFVRMAKNPVR